MKVKVRKRKTAVTGTNLYRGDELEISQEVYDKYPEEFIKLDTEKKKPAKKKTYKKYVKQVDKEVEDEI